MKISTGVKWGLVAGLIVGLATGIVDYFGIDAIKNQLADYIYREAIAQGASPEIARRAAQTAVEILPLLTIVGGVIVGLIIYIIVGVVLAVLWERLKMPWYAKGALFGVVLLLIFAAPSLIVHPPPGVPTPPVAYLYAKWALDLAGPIFLAWLLERKSRA
ncbi:conserved hypothetical protein [Pyrobaculum islandicum DSM 4184]|uniref:Uncharacterized protein n=1 Tax=Pyrobaculum islandicum (strain DSM 4184 / JCM 9189 / GEO3) TaxID=384616 RepID=A1RQN4_PYRIL|nr:hypothetical protein [Pyrobaculum islandicum]ABL87266.1 conserved hypothetical protein [Pyrobaculum islandicum DSM 4184]